MFKVISDDKVAVVFRTKEENHKIAATREVDEETIKDEEKLKEMVKNKDYYTF